MENVYDIKREKNLTYILSEKYQNNVSQTLKHIKAAVIIHLHYSDTVTQYLEYIAHVPESADVYLTTSNRITKEKIIGYIKERGLKNCFVVDKKNRGRDISSLLVACRRQILDYKYICFIHDKKEKKMKETKDVRDWNEGLWRNTLASEEYIYNILELFERNETLGVLAPPNPVSSRLMIALVNTWYDNFEQVKSLAEELHLHCDLDQDKSPITLGTVFWCRVDALKKLFLKEWKYEDFPEEPMPSDGTISHAVERILAYAAQDAGYDTGTVMTDIYAGKEFEYRTMVLARAFEELGNLAAIGSVNDLFSFQSTRKKLMEIYKQYEKIYIYGAGYIGKRVFAMLLTEGESPEAFVVSNGYKTEKMYENIPIYELSELSLTDTSVIILAMEGKNKLEAMGQLEKLNFMNVFVFSEIQAEGLQEEG